MVKIATDWPATASQRSSTSVISRTRPGSGIRLSSVVSRKRGVSLRIIGVREA